MGSMNKRKRSDGHGKRSKGQKNNAGKRVTRVDSLAWTSVDVPEMFDDAEGFFGLEEVEGVDVVREGDVVKFVSVPTSQKAGYACILTHFARWLPLRNQRRRRAMISRGLTIRLQSLQLQRVPRKTRPLRPHRQWLQWLPRRRQRLRGRPPTLKKGR
jgi:hypothetical protein